jgi:DNA-binding NtrC family response regulator
MANMLVIDDDENILEVIQTRLESNGYFVEPHTDPLEALESMKEKAFDVVISDIRMPGMDGIELLRRIKCLNWDIPVILLTAYGTIADAVEAVKLGAFQYLTKPFQGKQLIEEVEAALEERGRLQTAAHSKITKYFPGVYGVSPAMQRLYPDLVKMAETDSTVLIQGESGTGKELIAQMIHYNGPRRDKRFVIMDCGATPGSLIESELFGHARGSFTNATESRKGIVEAAHGGTLLLDEIGSMPLDLQTRLLRFLQEGQIRRLGENQMRAVDVRVLAATNVELEKQVEKGRFRLDLYYRLAVLKVSLPPLRDRMEDIPLLVDYFLQNFSGRLKKGAMWCESGVLEALEECDWPGNIREMKNLIEAGVVLSEGNMLSLKALESAGLKSRYGSEPTPRAPGESKLEGESLPNYLQRKEKKLIIRALEENEWVQKDAAHQLGISPRMLHYKIRKMNIRPAYKSSSDEEPS